MFVSPLISQISSTIIHLRKVFFVVTRGNQSAKLYFACIPKIPIVQVQVLSFLSIQFCFISLNKSRYCFIKYFKNLN